MVGHRRSVPVVVGVVPVDALSLPAVPAPVAVVVVVVVVAVVPAAAFESALLADPASHPLACRHQSCRDPQRMSFVVPILASRLSLVSRAGPFYAVTRALVDWTRALVDWTRPVVDCAVEPPLSTNHCCGD